MIGLEDLPARVPQITATEAKWETGRADGNDVVTWENSPFLSGASFVLRLRSRLQLRRLSLPPRPSVSDAKQPVNSQLPFTLQPFPFFFFSFFSFWTVHTKLLSHQRLRGCHGNGCHDADVASWR